MTTWRAVWESIDARRIELGWNKNQLYDKTGISEKSFRLMRRDGIGLTQPEKITNLCDGVRWSHRSIDLILQGGEPENVEARIDDPVKQLASIEQKIDEVMDLLRQLARRTL